MILQNLIGFCFACFGAGHVRYPLWYGWTAGLGVWRHLEFFLLRIALDSEMKRWTRQIRPQQRQRPRDGGRRQWISGRLQRARQMYRPEIIRPFHIQIRYHQFRRHSLAEVTQEPNWNRRRLRL